MEAWSLFYSYSKLFIYITKSAIPVLHMMYVFHKLFCDKVAFNSS